MPYKGKAKTFKAREGKQYNASRYRAMTMRGQKVRSIGAYGNKGKMGRSYTQSMAWHGSPFPRELTTQITYAENLSITSTIGAPSNYLFSSNSLYDPNVSGTGTQPRFFDSICGANNTNAPYQCYRVYGCKVTIECFPTGSDSTSMRGFIGIGNFGSSQSACSSLSEMRARSDYVSKPIGYWAGGTDFLKLSRYIRIKDLFGIKDMKDDEDTASVYNNSPVKAGRIAISYIPFDETSTRTIQCLVKIRYYVQFFQRNDVSDS